jgi:predicted transcriptional regulator
MSGLEREVYAVLRAQPSLTERELAAQTRANPNTLKHAMRRLRARGLVARRKENWAEHDGRCGPLAWRWRVTR